MPKAKKQVPCEVGFYRNPKTNRCKRDRKAPCPDGYYRNPETNRCKKERVALCPAGSSRNPETNRCKKDRIPHQSLSKSEFASLDPFESLLMLNKTMLNIIKPNKRIGNESGPIALALKRFFHVTRPSSVTRKINTHPKQAIAIVDYVTACERQLNMYIVNRNNVKLMWGRVMVDTQSLREYYEQIKYKPERAKNFVFAVNVLSLLIDNLVDAMSILAHNQKFGDVMVDLVKYVPVIDPNDVSTYEACAHIIK
jgi:hypothetical protein